MAAAAALIVYFDGGCLMQVDDMLLVALMTYIVISLVGFIKFIK